jgi:biofilm PGA synthesis lipoprotein PgaB
MKKHAFLFLLISAALHCTSLFAAQQSAVVLMYHHFGVARYPSTNIRLEQFDQHLQFLEKKGFNVLPLMTILQAIRENRPLPDKAIAITMDDAYRSVYSEAYPRLKELGWPFTVFVSTDYIDKHFSNYMTWEQMREMEQHGATYGNHSRTHNYLVRRRNGEDSAAWRQRVTEDITSAQQRLHDELHNVVDVIAYPYGEYNLALADVVEGLGMIGMGQHSGAIGPTSDFRFLPRFPMAEKFGDMEGFTTKVLSLAMPLQKTPAIEPVTEKKRPLLILKLDSQHPGLKQLTCYASGQGRIEVTWLNEFEFSVKAKKDLPDGRSRYNCTAPSGDAGRYYWFSQPWIRPGGVETEKKGDE